MFHKNKSYKFSDTVALVTIKKKKTLCWSVELLPMWDLSVPDWNRKWLVQNYFKKIHGRKGPLYLQETIAIISQHPYGMRTKSLFLRLLLCPHQPCFNLCAPNHLPHVSLPLLQKGERKILFWGKNKDISEYLIFVNQICWCKLNIILLSLKRIIQFN